MTTIHDEPERFAASALEGFCDVHARLVCPVPGGADPGGAPARERRDAGLRNVTLLSLPPYSPELNT